MGPNIRSMEPIHHNRWQNGFTAPDGTVYGIPLKGSTVLRIRHNAAQTDEPFVSCIGGPYKGLNKWEGGVHDAKHGDMYCMPLNSNFSLRIRSKQKSNTSKTINVIAAADGNVGDAKVGHEIERT